MTLARAYLTETGRVAARRLGPLIAGVGTVAVVLFGGNGMDARDALQAMAAAPALGGGLFLCWIVAAAPAARPLFGTAPALYLRALAPPRRFYPAIAAALAVVEAPWVILHARGAGALAGAAALASAAAAHALLVGRRWLLLACVLAAVTLGLPAPWLLAAGAAALVAGLPAGYRAAAEGGVTRLRLVAGAAPVALALSYLAGAWRGARPAWTRLVLVTAAGAALTWLLARNNGLRGGAQLRFALACAGPVLVVALGGVVQAVLVAEAATGWLLSSTGASPALRAAGRAGAAGAAGALAGLGQGLVAGAAGAAAGVGWGAAIGVALCTAARRGAASAEATFVYSAAVAAAFALAGVWL